MKNKTCCFTGHRIISANECQAIQKRLEDEIITLIHQSVRYFGAGGALEFYTMAALTVLKLKEKYLQIKLILVLPCPDQMNLGFGYTNLLLAKYTNKKQSAEKCYLSADCFDSLIYALCGA